MNRRTLVLMAIAVLTLTLAASTVAWGNPGDPTDPYANTSCRYCHEDTADRVSATNTVNFHVPAVDYATACKKCHWVQPSSHPYHKSNYKCASCHFGFENGNRAMFPSVVSSSGAYFASAGSVTTTDYALLHTIHGTSRWPTNARATNSKCASCHARAACRVCHAGVIPQTHGDHTWDQVSQSYNSSFTPPATRVCTGTQVGVENQISSAVITETCYMADCHNVSTSTPDAERVEENDGSVAYAPALGADTRYNWVQRSDYRMTNRLDASATLTFYGMKASVIGWKGPLCSAIQVYVDGVSQGTFDNFQSGATVKGQILYTTPTLSKATHTLTLVVRQGVSGSSSHYTMLDYFTVYPALATLKGNCSDPCHVVKLYNHDPNSFDHVSGSGPSVETTVSGGSKNFTCADCHNMQVSSIGGEHGRASSVSSPGALPMDCTTCHPAYADNTSIPLSVNAWNSTTPSRTCYFLACHSPSSPRAAHKQMASDHATPTASNARLCMGRCHASSIATMHANAVKIGDATRTSCKVCHTSNQMPVAGNNCIDCHYVMEGHYYTGSEPTHTITNAEATSTYLGFACNKCHLTQLNPEHQKASSLATTGATPGCTYCHERSWFPTTAWNKTCGACHAGGGKAPASHTATLTKHDYTSSNAFCGGSDCHSVTDASVTHQTPRSDCISSCHTTATVVTTATTCYSGTCHNGNTAYHPTTAAAHVGTQTACITGCHDLYLDTAVGHGGSGLCAKCHANATLTAVTGFVKGSYSNLCTGCHKSGGGGLSSHNYLPVDPNHSTGNDTSHTATGDASTGRIYAGNGDTSGTACTNLCHVTALASEHATVVAQGAGASANGQVTCVECHADNSYNSSVTVHANWTQRRCSNCHDYAAHVTHDTTSTLHNLSADASNTACANTGCHSAITPSGLASDIAALHSSASTSTFTSCNVCHRNDGKVLGIRSGGTVTKCVNCHVDHSATGIPSHDSTSSSDGCSQAGTGCHGVSYANYGAGSSHRWGDMSSLGGGCGGRCHNSYYANIVIATWNSGFNCVTCHKAGAGWVGGHDYTPADPNHSTGNDTSHTATMAYNQYSTVATGGVACNLCHTATMKSVHTTTSVGVVSCNSCHNNTSLGSTGVVKTSWPAKKCTDCHATSHDAYASAHTTATGCTVSGAGCHNSSDVKVLHSNAATGSLTGCRVCHKTADMLVGTLSCSAVGCHTPYLASYTPTDPAHSTGNDTSHTANITAGLYSGVATDGVACNLCHTATMKSVHTTTTVGIVGCASCHNNTSLNSTAVVKTNWTNRLCTACHTSSHDAYASVHTTTVAGCTNSGAGCHASTDVKVLHSTATTQGGTLTGCRVCHKTTDMLVGTLSCSTVGCHQRTVFSPVDPQHYYGTETSHSATGDAATGKIYSGAGDTSGTACTNLCHSTDLRAEHATVVVQGAGASADGVVTCSECHNDTSLNSTVQVKTNWPARTCAVCHDYAAYNTHDTTSTAHNLSADASNTACANTACHSSLIASGLAGDVAALHSTAGTSTFTTCNVCHRNDVKVLGILSGGTVTKCVNCHVDHSASGMPGHVAASAVSSNCAEAGAGCHNSLDNIVVHPWGTGGTLGGGCGGRCHDGTTYSGIKTWTPKMECETCHMAGRVKGHTYTPIDPNHSTGNDTSHTATMAYNQYSTVATGGVACNLCHTATMKSVHTTTSVGIVTCAGCHNNTSLNSTAVVKTSWPAKKCTDCHTTTHAEYASDHTTTVAGCTDAGAGCHNTTDVRVLHSAATTQGGTLTGCRVCHKTADMLVGTLSCSASGCHTPYLASYTPTDPAHSTGNDTSHTANITAGLYSGVATGGVACNLCHTATMKSVHTTTSVGIVTCAGCHNNTSLNSTAVVKTNWTNRLCTACHSSSHDAYASLHTTAIAGCTASGAGCHASTDVKVLHSTATTQGGTLIGCRVCHKTADMLVGTLSCGTVACHQRTVFSPVDPQHYYGTETSHVSLPASMGAYVTTAGATYKKTCADCHFASRGVTTTVDLRSEHATLQTGYTAPNMSCEECHNDTSLNSTAVVKTNWVSRTCGACHGSTSATHTTAANVATATGTRHNFSADASNTACASGGCHTGFTVGNIARGHSLGTTMSAQRTSCNVCHDDADTNLHTVTKCADGRCHLDKVPAHGPSHDGSMALGAQVGILTGQTYKLGKNVGCFGCHFSDLVREHGPAAYIPSINATGAGRSMNGGNGGTDGCGVCHNNKGTPGSYSSNASITAAITNKDHRCTSCHNGASSGTSAAHVPTVSTTVSYLSTGTIWKNPANEFVDGPSRGGHNSMGVWFPKSANLNATTTVWPIPADATFGIGGTTPWVANGYTTTATPVLCSDCHDFGTWLAGPQGANVKITIAQGYSPSQYSSPTASNWTATGNNRIICDKCHPLTTVVNLPAGAHTNHDTRAGAGDTCIDCHIRVPHAWVRPRLLRRTYGGAVGSGAAVKGGAAFGVAADTLPYADPNRLVLVGFQWKADMTTWSAGTDCVTSCGKHLVNVPANGFWP